MKSLQKQLVLETRPGIWLAPTIWTSLCFLVLPTIATAIVSGRSSVEKVVTHFTQPLFLLLFCSIIASVVLMRASQRLVGWSLLTLSTIVWLTSSAVVVNPLLQWWEGLVVGATLDPDNPFDYLVVLGGSTGTAPDGRAHLGPHGDRVLRGAELYLGGFTRQLVTTGDTLVLSGSLFGSFSPKDSPSEQTKIIWSRLKIPSEDVFTLAGENTSKEVDSLRLRPEWWKEKRCAILTSAFHMPRAMRLVQEAEIQVEPIPANFLASQGPLMVEDFLPDTHRAGQFKLLIKEWIAAVVRR